MKTTLSTLIKIIFSFALIIIINSKGQTQNLVSLDTNYTWSVGEKGFGFWINTHYLNINGDTIIGSYTYKKVYKYNDSTLSNPVYSGALRESVSKVYFHSPVLSQGEGILYDFSLSKDNSCTNVICQMPFNVDSVDQIMIDGQSKKRLIFNAMHGVFSDQWIEGIGSTFGLLYAHFNICFADAELHLLCVKDGNDIIYMNPHFSSCYKAPISLDEKEFSSEVKIYPNPVISLSVMEISSNHKFTNLKIYDICGRIIQSYSVENNYNIILKKEEFKSGMYYYRLSGQNTDFKSGKFVVR